MSDLASPRPTADEEFAGALSHVQRRTILVTLLDRESASSEFVPIADGDTDDSVPRLVELTEVHLPKLEAEGLIEWDRPTHSVARGPNFEAVQHALEGFVEDDDQLP
jgi:hypothetical protein